MPDFQDTLLPDSSIPFAKMHGSGNDFVVIDHRKRLISPEAEADFVRAVCQRRTGIGADGVVFIEIVDAALPDAHEAAFSWRYVNADGSAGEMCGNGAMCGARFAVVQGIAPSPCAFQTPAGLVRADVGTAGDPTGPRVVLAMVDATSWVPPRTVQTSIGSLEVASILVGVPHAVIVVDDADAWPESGSFDAIGRELRMHPAFAPAGTNVNVISVRGTHDLRMRTWERGVEAETLACGTGAVASVVAASRQGLVDLARPVTVHASGGWPLTVAFTWDEVARVATGITLAGQAIVVARGELDPEAWRSGTASAGR